MERKHVGERATTDLLPMIKGKLSGEKRVSNYFLN